ncbi:aldehyde dehydrogenase family protein, partial [bacterium]|nr:aldehyde dehydrogenase family protein [bacterium]
MGTDQEIRRVLSGLGIEAVNPGASDGAEWFGHGPDSEIISPVNGKTLAKIKQADVNDYDRIIREAHKAFHFWRQVPAPRRGEMVRLLGVRLREKKDLLGRLVTLEMGKSIQEGWGEVQEMIDICDMACGQSRMLYGVTTQSERAKHRMFEQWHPLGIVGVITAFNFPVAVWSWNTAIALICGDVVVWKPASAAPLCAIACQKLFAEVLRENRMPAGISNLVVGRGSEIGECINNDRRIPLISYTGSTRLGRHIAEKAGARLGRTILELGGNNAVIV